MLGNDRTTVGLDAARRIAVLLLAFLAVALLVVFQGSSAKDALAAQARLEAGTVVVAGDFAEVSSSAAARLPGANAKGKASVIRLFRFGWSDGEQSSTTAKTTSSYDVTGDGLADALCFSAVPLDGAPGLAEHIEVQLDGTAAYILEAGPAGIDQATFSLITLKGGEPFLFASAYVADGSARQFVLRYRSGAFEPVIDNALMAGQGVSDAHISSVKAVGNRIIVQFEFVSTVTGISRTSFTYTSDGSALKLANDTTLALRYATTTRGAFTKLPRKTACAFTAYASPSLTGASFVVKKGETVRPLGVKLSGGGLLYKLGYGKKTGWVRCPQASSSAGGALLSGVYGCTPLDNEPLAYSPDKKPSVVQLQKLSNHALYIVRNEVYARQGMVFASDELNTYFPKQSWYVSTDATTVTLSKVDAAYVALLQYIENNRKSPYVS